MEATDDEVRDYLGRLGFVETTSRPSLSELMEAQAAHVPFENVDNFKREASSSLSRTAL